MSLAEDYEFEPSDFEYNTDNDEIFKEYLLGKLFWNTRDGKLINVKDMENSHILNCLRLPVYPNKENWDIVFKFEIKRRTNTL